MMPCKCDAAVADHAIIRAKSHPDNGNVTIWFRCYVCGTRWDREYTNGEYMREIYESEPPMPEGV